MAADSYVLRFFAVNQEEEICPLTVRLDDKPFLIRSGDPLLFGHDALVRRIYYIFEQKRRPSLLKRVKFLPEDNLDEQYIDVLLVHPDQLRSRRFFFHLTNSVLRQTSSAFDGSFKKETQYFPRPVITIGTPNIFSMYEESPGQDFETESEITYWRDIRDKGKALYNLELDHRIKFLDSSIWHRYVSTEGDFDANFRRVLSHFVGYADNWLYESLATKATLEFHCRMLQHSFIDNYGDHGHQEAVTPFKFHSETVMERRSKKMLRSFFYRKRENGGRLSDIKWTALMIDDYSNKEIVQVNGSGGRPVPTKKQCIETVLNGAPSPGGRPPLHIHIQSTASKNDENIITGAINMLQNPTKEPHDIILLDYLLGKSELNPKLKAYGHEFLLELATHPERHSFPRGPIGKHWIFPISSFPFAFWDKLRQMNLDGSTEKWRISSGGDPLAAPELFRFNFLRLLARQIAEFYLHEAALERWIGGFDTISDKAAWIHAVRMQMAADKTKSKLLVHDRKKGSAFAGTMEDFLGSQTHYNQFWEKFPDWLQLLSNHENGRSTAHLLDNLHTLLDNPEKDFVAVIKAICRQVERLVKDSEKDLKKHAERLCINRDNVLIYNNQDLFAFPAEIPAIHPTVKKLHLSGNHLTVFTLEAGQWPDLEEINLSSNPLSSIQIDPAHHPKLKTVNLSNTGLHTDPYWNYYANDRKEVQHLLAKVSAYTGGKDRDDLKLKSLPLKVYISHSGEQEDLSLLRQLKSQMAALVQSKKIKLWEFGALLPGDHSDKVAKEHLERADIVLLLVSSDYIASDHIKDVEVPLAMQMYATGNCVIVPVLIRTCEYDSMPYSKLAFLPIQSIDEPVKAVAEWPSTDAAFAAIVRGMTALIDRLAGDIPPVVGEGRNGV